MKTLLCLILLATADYALACTTQTYIVNGTTLFCTTCCANGNCVTTCQ